MSATLLPHVRRARDYIDRYYGTALTLEQLASQPELELALMTPGPPLDSDAADFVRRQLDKGQMGGIGLHVDDCHQTYTELSAKGVTFLQEPADRPYGVEAVMRDNSGNWLVLVEPKEPSSR